MPARRIRPQSQCFATLYALLALTVFALSPLSADRSIALGEGSLGPSPAFPVSTTLTLPTRVRVGYPPIPGIYDHDQTGARSDYFYDIQRMILSRLGIEVEYVEMPWTQCLSMLATGEIDLLGFVTRESFGDFLFDYGNETILTSWGTILVDTTFSYSGIESLNGTTVALIRSLPETSGFLALARSAGIIVVPRYSEDEESQIASFRAGEAEAIVLPSYRASALLRQGGYVDTHIVFSPRSHGFALRKDFSPELLDAMDRIVLDLRESDPTLFATLKARYLDPPPVYRMAPWMLFLILALALAGIISFIFVVLLRYQVHRQTQTLTTQRDAMAALALRAEAANQELESFSYSVSHDLRAPLRAIEGFTAILAERYGPKLGEDGLALTQRIRKATQSMDTLIASLLTLSRVGKAQLSIVDLDMEQMARSVLDETESEEIRAAFSVTIGSLPPARGDATLVRQVWANLLSNAFKYSMRSSRKEIEIEGTLAGTMCQYRITDHGAGFDPAEMDRLFGVFQRLHSASEFPGTGVGLATVRRIVVRHGGHVSAEGHPGEGATFTFSLPALPVVASKSIVQQKQPDHPDAGDDFTAEQSSATSRIQ